MSLVFLVTIVLGSFVVGHSTGVESGYSQCLEDEKQFIEFMCNNDEGELSDDEKEKTK